MATLALEETNGARPAGPAAPMTAWQVWGLILIAPYLLVFLVFVLYPVAYGFWLARAPQTYVRLFGDPIFPRSVLNTLAFLLLGLTGDDGPNWLNDPTLALSLAVMVHL